MRAAAAPLALTAALLLSAGLSPATAAPAGGPLSPETLKTADRLREQALADNRAYEILSSLLTEVGPRFAGSEGLDRAVVWGEAKLRELGFSKVWTEPVKVPHWVRDAEEGRITGPFPQKVVLTALGGSAATPAEGLEAEVLRVTSLEEVKALPDGAAAGKIVFIDETMERTADGSGYGRAVQKRAHGPSEAAKKGAAAVLIRTVGTSTNRIAHTGGTWYQEGVRQIPAAALSNPDSDVLARQMERAPKETPVRFFLRLLTRDLPEVESANVLADLPGREAPEEIVLLGCHLDSWDVTPGAHDDGAGCATVIEAVRQISLLGEPPRRTLRVVLYANEEFKSSGGRAYAAAHEGEAGRHVAAIESDLGGHRVLTFTSGGAPDAEAVARSLAEALAPLSIEYGGHIDRGGVDISPLKAHQVPMFGLWQDVSKYFDVHHTLNDTLDQVDPEELSQNVAAYAVFAYLAAEMEGDFGRTPPPEEEAGR